LKQFQEFYKIAKKSYKDEQHPEVQKAVNSINRVKQQIDGTGWGCRIM
jgi:hypothetical protein